MDAYAYQAALWCEDCINIVKVKTVKPDYVDESDESTYDSDDWPKGPFADGGGDADCPQHCDGCGCFLGNPLTVYGEADVKEAVSPYVSPDDDGELWLDRIALVRDRANEDGSNGDVIATWFEAYGYLWRY